MHSLCVLFQNPILKVSKFQDEISEFLDHFLGETMISKIHSEIYRPSFENGILKKCTKGMHFKKRFFTFQISANNLRSMSIKD